MQILCLVVEILLSVMEIPQMMADDKLSLTAKRLADCGGVTVPKPGTIGSTSVPYYRK